MKNGRTQLVAILLAMAIAFTCGIGGGYAALKLVSSDTAVGNFLADTLDIYVSRRSEEEAKSASPTAPATNIKIDSQDYTIAEAIAEKVLPSVVGISTKFTAQGGYGFFGGNYSYDTEGVGTGVIIDPSGYILTNSHVIADGEAKQITVSLHDNSTAEGTIIWYDSTLDLAIVKIDKDGLVAAELGDSDELSIGSYAAAIGNPLGLQFERSMSQGIISGLNRTISVSSSTSSAPTTMEGLIQTDASINGGNSGGPLLNSRGQVIGINTAKATNGEGLGFAIPINVAKPIIEQVLATGAVTRPYIGISGFPLEAQTSYSDEQLEEIFGTTEGIYVSSVLKDGGAEAAGIEKGDVIIKLNGTPVSTMNKLNTMLITFKPGDVVEVTVLRDKEEITYSVTLTDGNITM